MKNDSGNENDKEDEEKIEDCNEKETSNDLN